MTAVARTPRCAWCGGETYDTITCPPVPICEGCGKTPSEAYLGRNPRGQHPRYGWQYPIIERAIPMDCGLRLGLAIIDRNGARQTALYHLDDALNLRRVDQATSNPLAEMTRLDEELGLYDTDEKVPPALAIEAGADETLQAAQPEGQERGSEGQRPMTSSMTTLSSHKYSMKGYSGDN